MAHATARRRTGAETRRVTHAGASASPGADPGATTGGDGLEAATTECGEVAGATATAPRHETAVRHSPDVRQTVTARLAPNAGPRGGGDAKRPHARRTSTLGRAHGASPVAPVPPPMAPALPPAARGAAPSDHRHRARPRRCPRGCDPPMAAARPPPKL
jgi:hypothetical protein